MNCIVIIKLLKVFKIIMISVTLLPAISLARERSEIHRFRHVRRRRAPYQRPVHPLEERMLLDLRGASFISDPLLRLLDQQSLDEIPRGRAHVREIGEPQRLFDHVVERRAVLLAFKRRRTVEELVDEDP